MAINRVWVGPLAGAEAKRNSIEDGVERNARDPLGAEYHYRCLTAAELDALATEHKKIPSYVDDGRTSLEKVKAEMDRLDEPDKPRSAIHHERLDLDELPRSECTVCECLDTMRDRVEVVFEKALFAMPSLFDVGGVCHASMTIDGFEVTVAIPADEIGDDNG